MIQGNIYALTALVCALVCAAVLRCNNNIYEKNNVIRKYFSFLLVAFILTQLVDSVWGFMYAKTLDLGRLGFNIVSLLIHLLAIFSVACWCIFLTNYFGFRESRTAMTLQCIPLVIAFGIFATQITSHTVFYIDENCEYLSGPYRLYPFMIQYSYFVLAFLKVLYFLIKNRKEISLKYTMIVLECAVIPVAFGILQYLFHDGPFSSLGLMFSAVVVFNGMMVIEKHRNSQNYEMISKETYMTLEALSYGFVSVIMIDLLKDENIVIKTTPYVEKIPKPEGSVQDVITTIFRDVADPDYVDELMEFSDLKKLPEKMYNRKTIRLQYRSKGIGWCVASFIAVERDRERNLKKVVLAIESIDEQKRKEQEYEDALARAYKNENAVFAELIKMQSTGVVASLDRKVFIVNDAALDIFGYKGGDPIGMDIFEFWSESHISTPEEIKDKILDIEENGGSFSYQTVAYDEEDEEEVRYLSADIKRVDLLDGTKVMITCFNDITSDKLVEDKLRTLSETDVLTGIANRRCGESQIKLLLHEGVPGLFCLFDVNEFKKINDTFGHQTGDDTLVAVAKAVSSSFRANDIIMRLGGDEFAMYMRGVTTKELAKLRLARLFENIARIELENIPKGSVTISLGAVMVEEKDGVINDDYTMIYKRADALMYGCKGRAGSNMAMESMTEAFEKNGEEQ